MRVKEIELDNFKSFGEKVTIPILNGFTTVSGPNGSGKSNVIDSLMFALGLTSTRNMRAERLTDLLNNISGKKECSVKVIFIDDESGEEAIVLRRIRVKGENYDSKYFLDGSPSTLGQIHDKLANYNISPKGFNVVMQGDVASIISMGAVDRRKIIDEIAGVAEFDRKIELAAKELTVVYERIESQEIILGELKQRLEQLQKDRDQAVKYSELKKQRTTLERKFLNVRIKQVTRQSENARELVQELEDKKTSLRAENIEVNLNIQNTEEDLVSLNKRIEELGEGKQRELGIQKEELQTKLAHEESAIQFLDKQITDYESEIKSISREIKSLKEKIKEINFRSSEFTEEKKNIQENITEEQAKYDKIQSEIRKKSTDSDLSNKSLIEVQDKISTEKEERSKFEQEKARLDEQKRNLEEKVENHKEEASKSLDEIHKLEAGSMGSNILNLDALKEQIAFQSRNIQSLKDEQKDTKSEIDNQQDKLRKVEKQLNQLEGQEQAANAAGYGRAVEAVLSLEGVHGTLAQLGTVDDEYKLALETAAGARLRSVVTEDDYIAQDAINFLRKNNLGRATFLPLNKLNEAKDLPQATMPGIIDWAINLVSFDYEYRDAFAYAFANTLVVKNIEVARKLIGRYRMVTLQGDLIERSGAMSGGSAIKTNIHFGANSANEKSKLETNKTDIINFVKQLQSEYQELENQIDESREKLEKLRSEYSEKSTQSSVTNTQLENARNKYEKDKAAITANAEELNNIEVKIDELVKSIEIKTEAVDTLESSMQAIASVLKDSGLESLMEESREVEVEIKRYQSMFTNLLNEESRLEVEKSFNTENTEKAHEKLNIASVELSKLKEEVPQHLANKERLSSEIAAIQSEINKIKESISGLNQDRESMSNNLLNLRQRKGEISSSIESTAMKLVESRKKLTELLAHLEQLLAEKAEQDELKQNSIEEKAEGALYSETKGEEPELTAEEIEKLQKELNKIERQMQAMEPINMRAVEEYDEVKNRESEIVDKQKSLTDERQMLIEKADSYKDQKLKVFKENFEQINTYFQEIFANLSFGQGQLILEDPETVFNGGLVIKAQPRGKKMQRLEAMSGGEKSLTALSFLFALQQCNPAPFYAFDEVDSALDGLNVDRLAEKIQNNSRSTQFLVVSHRRPMLEKSDRAIGVSLNKKGFSTVIGVQNIEKEVKELVAS